MGKVLSAQGSGYFPGCIEPYGGYFSLINAMKIYWRVKSWTISGEYAYGPYSYDFSQTFTSTLSEEASLVCLANNLDTDFYPDVEVGNTGRTYFQRPYSFYWNSSSLFYPDLLWQISFPDPAFPDERSVGTQLSDFNEATYTILGYTMPCGVTKKDGDEFISEANNVIVVPASYWSYGGTYDTSTGEPLT